MHKEHRFLQCLLQESWYFHNFPANALEIVCWQSQVTYGIRQSGRREKSEDSLDSEPICLGLLDWENEKSEWKLDSA